MNRVTIPIRSLTKTALSAALLLSAPAALTLSKSAAAQSGASAGQGDLSQAVTALRGISTMQANFTQTDRNGQRVAGVMTLKRPGRIRFQYQKGVPLLIVSDGKALTLVDYEVRQVQRWPISNSPLGALLDPRRDVMKYGKLQPTSDPNVISVEVRDKAHPEFGVITMIFQRKAAAPGGLELSSWVALDSQNQRTTVRLNGHRYGLAVADSMFRYNDPRSNGPR
jgi:outer membrane lipoprotein-sorting protein